MIELYIDGASNGNPGLSGAGIYMKVDGKVYEHAIPLGIMSNHEAEFFAIMKALELCSQQFPNEILAFQTDSQLVVDAIEKNYIKNPVFQPLLKKIMKFAKTFPEIFIKWIPREQNFHADRLAKKAIQMQKNNNNTRII